MKGLACRQAGLTLMEVLVAMGISILVGALLVVIIVNSAGLYSKESINLQGGLNSNNALGEIRQTIKQSSAIISSYTDGAVTFTSGNDRIVLKVSSTDSLGNLISDTFDYFVFFKDANILRLKTFPDTASSRKTQDRIFSTNVDSLKFQYLNSANPPEEVTAATAAKVKVTLSIKQKNGTNYEIRIATSEADLRND